MKRAVGAIAVYDDPEQGRTALLQVRKDDDSFPGCVEKTWGGGLENDERFSEAICREYREEVAECIKRAVGSDDAIPESLAALQKPAVAADDLETADVADAEPGSYTLRRLNILRVEGKKLVVTLLCEIHDPALVEALQPLVERGVLLAITEKDLPRLQPLKPDYKTGGLPADLRGEGKLGMFQDEIDAVTTALRPSEAS